MLEVGPELGQADEGVADGGRQRGLGRQGGELGGEPGLEVVEDGTGVGLAQARPLLGRPAARRLLDRVELGDASDRLLGDRGALRAMDAGELAPDVGQAGDLTDGVLPVQLSEARVVVRVHPAGEGLQMALRVLALPVGRELVPGRGRRRPAPGPLVADVDPHPCGGGPAAAGGEHGDGGVVREERPAAERVPPDGGGERLQERRRAPDPVRQRRAVEIEPVASVDLALTIQGQVVAVLGHQDVGQKPWPGPAALDRARGQGRLHEALASPAGEARPRDAVHHEAAGDVLQLLGDVLAQASQATAAAGAGVLAGGDLDLHARDVVRDRPAPGATRLLVLVLLGQPQAAHDGPGRHLARLEGQMQLLGALARGAVAMRPGPGELVAELLDQGGLRLHLGDQKPRERLQVAGVLGQRGGLVEHGRS